MKVYLLNSDDGPLGVYSTPELAAEAAKRFGYGYGADEMELDQMPDAPNGLYAWILLLYRNGEVRECFNTDVRKPVATEVAWDTHDSNRDRHCWRVRCMAESREKAIEVATKEIQAVCKHDGEVCTVSPPRCCQCGKTLPVH